jgi:hypothetical protein
MGIFVLGIENEQTVAPYPLHYRHGKPLSMQKTRLKDLILLSTQQF